MSFWWYSKSSKGEPTVTSNAVYGRSWFSCLYAAYAYSLIAALVVTILISKFLPALHWGLGIPLIIAGGGITFFASLWFFRRSNEELDQTPEDDD